MNSWLPSELEELIRLGEGRGVEFKRGLPRDEKTARTLAAFANTRGGVLLIGVGDRGELLGAPKPAQTVQRLRAIAAHGLEPALELELEVVELSGLPIVVCSIGVSRQRPHTVVRADGSSETVVRAGSSNRAADGATLRALREQRTHKRSMSELEQRVLEWVRRECGDGAACNSPATVERFCRAQNIGRQRARRAFIELERHGDLVGHGTPSRRTYSVR
ncbi:MAG: ATP-binding protein [Planctomycetes bacterium]|nr:ATP-binding protein [Planctomycetota bacterium]